MYKTQSGFGFDGSMIRKLLYFGLPTGLMYVTESGGFTAIVLRIGRLGDIPLRATTMAINFNMIAFIPLVGVSIAASVLVGRHLLETGPARASQSAIASLLIGILYAAAWVVAYVAVPDWMMSLYRLNVADPDSTLSINLAQSLLGFVAIYIVLDSTQLILAGVLRGAGDTWYVLGSGVMAGVIALSIGITGEPTEDALHWWWWIITLWISLLATLMSARYLQGRWKTMRMV
jgi:MATE family multidrug resistance protein